jgi:hypothetical protein
MLEQWGRSDGQQTRDQCSASKWTTLGIYKLVYLAYIDFVKSMVELSSNWARSRDSYILDSKIRRPLRALKFKWKARSGLRTYWIANTKTAASLKVQVKGSLRSSYIWDSTYEDRCEPKASVKGSLRFSYILDSKYEDRYEPKVHPW